MRASVGPASSSRNTQSHRGRTAFLALTFFAALGLVLALAGCQDGKKPVEFVAILPLTGSASVYGEAIRKGVDLAAEEVKADSELPFDVTVTVEDSGSDPAKANELLAAAFDRSEVAAAIGGVTSAEALAMIKAVDDADRVLLSPSASSQALSSASASRNFFRLFPGAIQEATTMAQFTLETLKSERVAIIGSDTEFGQSVSASFRDVYSGEVVYDQLFPTGAEDVSEVTMGATDAAPTSIYVAATGDDLIMALGSLKALGYGGRDKWLTTSSALASPGLLAANPSVGDGVYFTQPPYDVHATEGPVVPFREAFQTKYGELPGVYAAHGYDAVKVLAMALVKGNYAFPSDVKKGIRAINDYQGVAGAVQFRETGDVQKFVRVYLVTEGQIRDYTSWLKEYQDNLRKQLEELNRQMDEARRNAS